MRASSSTVCSSFGASSLGGCSEPFASLSVTGSGASPISAPLSACRRRALDGGRLAGLHLPAVRTLPTVGSATRHDAHLRRLTAPWTGQLLADGLHARRW